MNKLDLNNLKVEFVRHVGQTGTSLGLVDVTFDQYFVHCNGNRVGIYCGLLDQPGKHLSFTVDDLPLNVQQAIAKEVAKQTGGVGNVSAPPPEEHEVETHDDE